MWLNKSIHSPKIEDCPRKQEILHCWKGLSRLWTGLCRPKNGHGVFCLESSVVPKLFPLQRGLHRGWSMVVQ